MNQINLQSRTAVVTGGARGIGLAIAHRLASSGAACSLWDRDGDTLAKAIATFPTGSQVQPVVVDVTEDPSVQEATRATLGRFGGIDILVNNAGIAGASKPTWELSPEEWLEVVRIDLIGVFLCCRAVVPHMLKQASGRIVNIASIAGKEGNPNASHYSAAKAGVLALTKSLGKELATSGILVNAIAPAVIETEMLGQMSTRHVDYMRSKIPMDRFGRKEEAAALVAWLCSEDCSFSTGAVYDLSGGGLLTDGTYGTSGTLICLICPIGPIGPIRPPQTLRRARECAETVTNPATNNHPPPGSGTTGTVVGSTGCRPERSYCSWVSRTTAPL